MGILVFDSQSIESHIVTHTFLLPTSRVKKNVTEAQEG